MATNRKKASVAAGDLRHQVCIQARSTDRDALNQQSDEWNDYLQVWASIEPLSGRELFAAEAVQSEVTHQITIRWQPTLCQVRELTLMRIVYRGRVFEISSAINVEERDVIIVMQAIEGLKKG